jgi:sec-independent protein translocase protein TatA
MQACLLLVFPRGESRAIKRTRAPGTISVRTPSPCAADLRFAPVRPQPASWTRAFFAAIDKSLSIASGPVPGPALITPLPRERGRFLTPAQLIQSFTEQCDTGSLAAALRFAYISRDLIKCVGEGRAFGDLLMGGMSIWHWLIVGLVVLLLFGGRGKLSGLMGDAAKGVKAFREGLKDDDHTPSAKREEDAAALPRTDAEKEQLKR